MGAKRTALKLKLKRLQLKHEAREHKIAQAPSLNHGKKAKDGIEILRDMLKYTRDRYPTLAVRKKLKLAKHTTLDYIRQPPRYHLAKKIQAAYGASTPREVADYIREVDKRTRKLNDQEALAVFKSTAIRSPEEAIQIAEFYGSKHLEPPLDVQFYLNNQAQHTMTSGWYRPPLTTPPGVASPVRVNPNPGASVGPSALASAAAIASGATDISSDPGTVIRKFDGIVYRPIPIKIPGTSPIYDHREPTAFSQDPGRMSAGWTPRGEGSAFAQRMVIPEFQPKPDQEERWLRTRIDTINKQLDSLDGLEDEAAKATADGLRDELRSVEANLAAVTKRGESGLVHAQEPSGARQLFADVRHDQIDRHIDNSGLEPTDDVITSVSTAIHSANSEHHGDTEHAADTAAEAADTLQEATTPAQGVDHDAEINKTIGDIRAATPAVPSSGETVDDNPAIMSATPSLLGSLVSGEETEYGPGDDPGGRSIPPNEARELEANLKKTISASPESYHALFGTGGVIRVPRSRDVIARKQRDDLAYMLGVSENDVNTIIDDLSQRKYTNRQVNDWNRSAMHSSQPGIAALFPPVHSGGTPSKK